MQGKNLWGAITYVANVRTPHEILLEQGELLVELTNGLLNFDIERCQKNTLFSYIFSLSVPKLNFSQPLLRVTHDIKLFPAILRNDQSGEEYTANGQDEFEEDLGSILSADETKTLLCGLMAQAKLESSISCGEEVMV